MSVVMTDRIARWHAAWGSRDADRVIALYAPDATHASALVARYAPDNDGTTLRGAERIAAYFRRALARFAWLRFEILTVTEDAGRSAVEYLRRSDVDGDHPAHVLELLEWRDGRIAAVRVFHF
jgi:ketosteroid isomerase-like protein